MRWQKPWIVNTAASSICRSAVSLKVYYSSQTLTEVTEHFGHMACETDLQIPETADSILCYACARPAMVVDAYTARLLNAFGYEFESYDELQEWCEEGIRGYFDTVQLPAAFARFHGMIVEYVKRNSKGKAVNIEVLKTPL